MGHRDRLDRSMTVQSVSGGTNAAGSITEGLSAAATGLACRVSQMTARDRDLVKRNYGLETAPDQEMGQADYHASAVSGSYLLDEDTGERWKIVADYPQEGFGDPHHLFLLLQKQLST